MSDFVLLTAELDGLYDKSLAELPIQLRQRVIAEMRLWDGLTAEQRHQLARQRDWENAPDNEEDNDRLFQLEAVLIPEWEACETPTALDKATQEARLAELRREAMAVGQRIQARVKGQPAQIASPIPTQKTDAEIMVWMSERRQSLKDSGMKHGRDILLDLAMKEFSLSYKIVRAIWDTHAES